jgi:hypothetical protein
VVVLLFGAAALGQDTRSTSSKVKRKDGHAVVADKSKPVRRALERQYAAIRRAHLAKDLDAMMALRTPDFEAHLPNGQVWDFAASRAYTQAAFEQVQRDLDVRFIIHEIDLNGSTAAAHIEQHWSRLQMRAGKVRKVETTAHQRETWLQTPQGWRLQRIDQIKPGPWFVDGKQIDPSKPYDPDAPEFKPSSRYE